MAHLHQTDLQLLRSPDAERIILFCRGVFPKLHVKIQVPLFHYAKIPSLTS